jgi:hypothetical protein
VVGADLRPDTSQELNLHLNVLLQPKFGPSLCHQLTYNLCKCETTNSAVVACRVANNQAKQPNVALAH